MINEENNVADPETRAEEAELILGKFEDVDALAHAYKALEAEFTRRSQRMKALEAAAPLDGNADEARAKTESGPDADALYRAVSQNEGVRARVVSEYLSSLRGVPLMAGSGAGVTAPSQKASSFREAAAFALGYLRNQH